MPATPSFPAREFAEKANETTTRALEQVRTLADVIGRHAAAQYPAFPAPGAAEAMRDLAARFARTPAALAQDAQAYAADAAQRLILFWDVMRQAGNNFVEHERAGCPPVLVFDYETVVDGRQLARPVNYALVRITPPEGSCSRARYQIEGAVSPRWGSLAKRLPPAADFDGAAAQAFEAPAKSARRKGESGSSSSARSPAGVPMGPGIRLA